MRTAPVILVALAAAIIAGAPAPGAAQDVDGFIDLERSVEQQITQIEQMVGGDAAARTQVVALQWLIELYGIAGRLDDIDRCYTRILALYPNDVGTLNSYGRYLMDTVGDNERAQKVLYDAYAWAKAIDARAIDMGTTFELRSELMRRMGDHETALKMADHALMLLASERSADVLRTKARSLTALERYDDAAGVYLQLIGLDRAANTEDVNEFKLIVSKTTQYDAGTVDRHIADAIEAYRDGYLARIELGGGTVVKLESEDGVVLEATLRRADGPGAVLFVNDTGEPRSTFTPYAQLVYIDGISSMAIDLRGHGGSRADTMLSFDALSVYNRDRLADDVVTAYRHLQKSLGLPDSSVAIVAAGAASAIVEKAIYRGRINAPVAHLSPSFPALDLELNTALSFHADHPVLVICAREDIGSMRAIRRLTADKPRRRLETRVFQDAGHGVETLRRVPDALEAIQKWLRGVVGSS